ncbi:unnamed protein product [Linum tenue]|uniref:3'-5' exonuclease domain-containing protein n=1 Tax=Linum tenue TaxID=586396 RepID=A0AAV0JLZ4_9ROSI|nr:unnamed protein product [Linum tenue]
MEPKNRLPATHIVASNESSEFARLNWVLARSSVIGLDAEWKPLKTQQSAFPNVSLLQLACQLRPEEDWVEVFLLDLESIPLPFIWELLREVFISPDILKLGFRFKQDLAYLSSTFCSHGCDPGFDKVEPYLDIFSVYHYLQPKQQGRKVPKETKSLATICKEILGIALSKELQCSDWSSRPLTEEQKNYAATDAHCLLQIFAIFKEKVAEKGSSSRVVNVLDTPHIGLKAFLELDERCNKHLRIKTHEALAIVRATVSSRHFQRIAWGEGVLSRTRSIYTMPMGESFVKIVRKYGEKILLRESDRKPRSSKKRGKRKPSMITQVTREKWIDDNICSWEGSTPWELSEGGDGYPKFLCDVMVEGLAKHLRCVGIDAAIPCSRKPDPRELIDQAYREKRVVLTRDAKLLRHQHLIKNQIYRVKSLLKNEQLLEVIETFNLKINENQLMSRCTKCNGKFIQKPLTTEEAVEAAKGFQKIPNCLFNKNLEFWQCMECNQLYWEVLLLLLRLSFVVSIFHVVLKCLS